MPGERLCYVCGVTDEVLFHNARALVVDHDAVTRSVVFNDKLLAFAKDWGFPTTSVCAVSGPDQLARGAERRDAADRLQRLGFRARETRDRHLPGCAVNADVGHFPRPDIEVRLEGFVGCKAAAGNDVFLHIPTPFSVLPLVDSCHRGWRRRGCGQ